MKEFSIGITTFSKRFSYLETLVRQLRTYTDAEIIISINGDYKKKFDEKYRKKILKLCLEYENVFPIFFPEQRGLSKLWNTLIIHSKTDWCFILNDDVEVLTSDIVSFAEKSLLNKPDFYRINESYSHFLIHKKTIDELCYFDERLLAFGEEDGDIMFRYIEKYNKWIPNLYIHGLNNLIENTADENIRRKNGKYSAFNTEFCFTMDNCKYVPDEKGISGHFSYKARKNLPDLNLYPYEKFFMENKHKL